MALDLMAIASWGTYPTPTPTSTQRAAYGVSYGLLSIVYRIVAGIAGKKSSWLLTFRRRRKQ